MKLRTHQIGCATLRFILTVSSVALCATTSTDAGEILLIEDQGGFGSASSVLEADGHNVTVINFEFAANYSNLLDGPFLAGFDLIVYGERGGGFGAGLPIGVRDSLEAYLQGGGHLLVTGYDTLGSPIDPTLSGLVRSENPNDSASGNPNWKTAAIDHPILNGPAGDFRNLTFSAIGYDDDVLAPAAGAGGILLATTPGVTGRILFTDLPAPAGSVGYWNGGINGDTSNAQPDFSSGGNPEGIFRNWAAFTEGIVAHSLRYVKGDPLPTAGSDPLIPVGATWYSFGVPAIDSDGNVAFNASWRNPAGESTKYGAGLFVDGALKLAVGADVPGMVGVTFKKFREPVISGDHLACIAFIQGAGIDPLNDTVVIRVRPTGEVTVLAQEGTAATDVDGATIKTLKSVSIAGGTLALGPTGIFYTATLRQGTGSPLVTSANDSAAWHFRNDVTTLVAREGNELIPGDTFKSFKLLNTVSGSPAQERSLFGPVDAVFPAKLASGLSALAVYFDGSTSAGLLSGQEIGGTTIPQALWKSFGPVAVSPGNGVAMKGTLVNGSGGVASPANTGIFLGSTDLLDWEPVVQAGDVAPALTDVTFKSLKDPVISSTSTSLAFAATLAGTGVDLTNDKSLWWTPAGTPTLIAREGTPAVDGGTWKTFTSLAIPGGITGPLFLASLAKGVDGIDSTNDAGVWGVDNEGDLNLLFREGVTEIGSKQVKAFALLKAANGSNGTTRAFNGNGKITWRAAFDDRTSGIVVTTVP